MALGAIGGGILLRDDGTKKNAKKFVDTNGTNSGLWRDKDIVKLCWWIDLNKLIADVWNGVEFTEVSCRRLDTCQVPSDTLHLQKQ